MPSAPGLRAWVRSWTKRIGRKQLDCATKRCVWAQLGVLCLEWHRQGGDRYAPSGGLPGWLGWWERSAAAWPEVVARVLWLGLGAGLCARVPVEGIAWACLFILVHSEEKGPGHRLWIGGVGAVKEQLVSPGHLMVLPAWLSCGLWGGNLAGQCSACGTVVRNLLLGTSEEEQTYWPWDGLLMATSGWRGAQPSDCYCCFEWGCIYRAPLPPLGLLVVRTPRGPLLATVWDCTDNRRHRRGIPLYNIPCLCRSTRHNLVGKNLFWVPPGLPVSLREQNFLLPYRAPGWPLREK
ncbi:hypothetical protein NDU88_003003 [Pleurodeles waltl]|uniref:Uncharacterized protein n=1 Tax=Pleurodeles waltl TaxID=8319 RepID=A0AAV7WU27_PLEWA|nr:hypothetical protein NDU88_003003 [Pleurodeles waltl]